MDEHGKRDDAHANEALVTLAQRMAYEAHAATRQSSPLTARPVTARGHQVKWASGALFWVI